MQWIGVVARPGREGQAEPAPVVAVVGDGGALLWKGTVPYDRSRRIARVPDVGWWRSLLEGALLDVSCAWRPTVVVEECADSPVPRASPYVRGLTFGMLLGVCEALAVPVEELGRRGWLRRLVGDAPDHRAFVNAATRRWPELVHGLPREYDPNARVTAASLSLAALLADQARTMHQEASARG